MAQQTIYGITSSAKFVQFLKRFQTIEQTLLLEIRNDSVKAKTHTSDRGLVKYSNLNLNDVFEHLDGTKDTIYCGIFNIGKIADSFKHFGTEQPTLTIEHDKLEGLNVATKIVIKNKKVTIVFDCASYRMFTHITDDMFNTISMGDPIVEFDLEKEQQSKITSISSIDDESRHITFKTEGNAILAEGNSFRITLLERDEKPEQTSLTFFKQYFNYVDKEDTTVKIIENDKIIFKSNESDTISVIGRTNG